MSLCIYDDVGIGERKIMTKLIMFHSLFNLETIKKFMYVFETHGTTEKETIEMVMTRGRSWWCWWRYCKLVIN